MKPNISCIVTVILMICMISVSAQNQETPPADDNSFVAIKAKYPEGVYETMMDFLIRKPTETVALTPKGLQGIVKPTLDVIEHSCFFYYTEKEEKIKNAFAVVYKGELFFQIEAILNNRNKDDKRLESTFPNGFVKVIDGGKRYMYTEVDLGNTWARAAAANARMPLGSVTYGKGVVLDIRNREFNVFKNCKDYNQFITPIYPAGVQNCKEDFDLLKVRADFNFIR